MSSLHPICPRHAIHLLVAVVLLSSTAVGRADPKPLSKEEQAKVNKAIDQAVAYLKRTQGEDGDWPRARDYWSNSYLIGQCLLTTYALLEAGVPTDDPVVQKAADYIRPKIRKSEETYELSLGVLFFDRLGNPKDKQLIQTLALRLVAGQHRTGGWNYRCPTLREDDEAILIKSLEDLTRLLKSGESLNAKSLNALHVPRELKPLTVFQDPKKIRWMEPRSSELSRHSQLFVGTTDNSNTQFAMLGLWVAQRHGIPVEPTFRLMVERFEKTQRKDGWWPYDLRFDRRQPYPSKSMICVGLLGLAIGCGLTPAPPKTVPPESEDSNVLNGLVALYQKIGFPTGQMEESIPLQNVYFLWSLERVAMLYNLPTLGDKDWYRWGAEMLVVNQNAGGDWDGSPIREPGGPSDFGPPLNTAFALLFLKRSHPMKDLTPKLPFTVKELNEGIARIRPSDSRLERSLTTPSRNTKPER
jgi:hypothetical protein